MLTRYSPQEDWEAEHDAIKFETKHLEDTHGRTLIITKTKVVIQVDI